MTQLDSQQRGRGDDVAERIEHARLNAVRLEADVLNLKSCRSRLDCDLAVVEYEVKTMPVEQRRLQQQLDFECIDRLNQDSSRGRYQDIEGRVGSEKRLIPRSGLTLRGGIADWTGIGNDALRRRIRWSSIREMGASVGVDPAKDLRARPLGRK